jgi:ribose 5-phosphate isomerase B
VNVALASDHAGYDLEKELVALVRSLGHGVIDLSEAAPEPDDDYPDSARAVALALLRGQAERAILVCGSGVGASIAVNKVPGARGAVCHDTFSARQGVEDDNANVLVLGARVIGTFLARDVATAFLGAKFSNLPRHVRRLDKVAGLEHDARAGIFEPVR